MLLAESLEFHARVRPGVVALIDEQRAWTFAELRRDSLILANIIDQNSDPGRVGVCAGSHGLHIALLYALAGSGREGVILDPKWSASEISNARESFGVTTVFADAGVIAKLEPEDRSHVIELSHELVTQRDPALSAITRINTLQTVGDPDATYIVTPSGGTSGRLKGIRISHRATVARFVTQLVEFGMPRGGRFLATTPLFHGGARSLGLGHLYAGASLQLLESFDPVRFLAFAEEATSTFCVPTMLRRLLKVASEPLPPTIRVICGGAALDQTLAQEVREKLTSNFTDYYASVESGPIAIRHSDDDSLPAGCVGRPAFGVILNIRDQDDAGIGVIEVSGDSIATGFEGDVDAVVKEMAEVHGLIRPGDIGRVDEHGYLHLLGRADDVIISGGVNVSPLPIERALESIRGIERAVVVGIPDSEWGQAVEAVVTLDNSESVDFAAVIQTLRDSLSSTSLPKKLHVVESLPVTAMGKISRSTVRDLVIAGTIS